MTPREKAARDREMLRVLRIGDVVVSYAVLPGDSWKIEKLRRDEALVRASEWFR